MIRIAILGLSCLFVSLFFASCYSVKPLREKGRLLSKSYKYYVNDSLRFSYRMGWDYNMFTEPKLIKEALEKNGVNLNTKHCLAHFETFIPPHLEHYLFYYKDSVIARRELNKLNKKYMKLDNLSLDKTIIDTLNHFLIKSFSLNKNSGKVLILAKSSKHAFLNLRPDYLDDVFKNITVGENYDLFTFESPFDIASKVAFREDSTVNYLYPVLNLVDHEANYLEMPINHTYVQALCTYQSFLSNSGEDLAANILKWRNRSYLKNKVKAKSAYTAYDDEALDFLLAACAKKRIVMFNENHFTPNHRLLLSLMLPKLYQEGFRYLAMESIWEAEEKLNTRGFAVTQTGFYTREPMAANMIREAIAMGFTVFGYDDFTKDREINQAKNIYERTLEKDSLAKVVVMAGFGHIHEKKFKGKRGMMAAKFKSLTNINPLTIDQVEFYSSSKHWLSIIDTSKLGDQKRMQTDMYLANNLTYDMIADKKKFINYDLIIPDSIISTINKEEKNKYIINIYRSNEFDLDKRATPVYNYVIKNTLKSRFYIKLPKSDYLITIKNKYGKTIYTDFLKIR